MNSITAATGKICCAVEAACFTSPFTFNSIFSCWGSEIARAEATAGPQGQKLSCHLPCSQSKNLSRGLSLRLGLGRNLRFEMSLMTV